MKHKEFATCWERIQQEIPDLVVEHGVGTVTFDNGAKFRLKEGRKFETFGTSATLEISYFLPRRGLIAEFLESSSYTIEVFVSACLKPAGFDFQTEWHRQERTGFTLTKILEGSFSSSDLLSLFNFSILLGETLTAFINHFAPQRDPLFEVSIEPTFETFNEGIDFFSQYWLDNHKR